MSFNIIAANPKFSKPRNSGVLYNYLNISEFFCDSIQGEGKYMGVPATFLRLQGCTMHCTWCDTKSIWKHGNPYTITELLGLMDNFDVPRKFYEGQHLVITGGSPLLQQKALLELLDNFHHIYGFDPIIEIENECTIMPDPAWGTEGIIWNNSPKLKNSGIPVDKRYHPAVLKSMSERENSYFKFVITGEGDWKEIEDAYIEPLLIPKSSIILMPEGSTREQLDQYAYLVMELAIKHNVKYSDRLQIRYWGNVPGV